MTFPAWEVPRTDYSVASGPVDRTDYERIEGNTLNLRNQAAPGGTTSGSDNAYSVQVVSVNAYQDRLSLLVKFHQANTGPITLNVNGLGPTPVVNVLGENFQPGDIRANQYVLISYTGTQFRAFSNTNNITNVAQGLYGETDVSSLPTAYRVIITGITTPLTEGDSILVKFNQANTGAATLEINGTTILPITKYVTDPLAADDIAVGDVCLLVHDGTNWQMVNTPGLIVKQLRQEVDTLNDVITSNTNSLLFLLAKDALRDGETTTGISDYRIVVAFDDPADVTLEEGYYDATFQAIRVL